MKAKLTSRSIKTLEPSPKAFEVVDTELKGFLLRVQPTGRKTFYYSYRSQDGQRKRIKIGTLGSELSLQQARDVALQHAAKVASGEDIQASKRKARSHALEAKERTLSRFIELKYKPWVMANLKSGQSTISTIHYSFPDLLNSPLNKISIAYIEKWRTEKLDSGLKPSTINRCVSSLRAVLTKAEQWEVIDEHPLRKLKALHVDASPKVRYLTSSEEERLLSALSARDEELKLARARGNEHRRIRGYELMPDLSHLTYPDRMTPMIILSLKTGMRRGELYDLTWEHVNFIQKVITITGEIAKSKRTRHIPLSPIAFQTLNTWANENQSRGGRVFPADDGGRLGDIRKSWGSILKSSDIQDFRWHDMRHDFASKLVMNGVPLNTVRELCGHSDLNTTLRYAHLAPDHKSEAVALIG